MQVSTGRTGLSAEPPLEGFSKLVVLAQGLVALAAPSVQAHQVSVRFFVRRIFGDRSPERVDGRLEGRRARRLACSKARRHLVSACRGANRSPSLDASPWNP